MKWHTNSWKCKLFKSNKKIQHFSVKLKWHQILKSILKCAVSCVETQKLDLCCCCSFFVSYFLLQNNSRVCLCAWWSKKYFKIRKRTRTYLGFLPSLAVKSWCSFFLNRETFFLFHITEIQIFALVVCQNRKRKKLGNFFCVPNT